MKMKNKWIIIWAIVLISNFSNSQKSDEFVTKSNENSLGMDFGLGNGSPNFGITYRRFFSDSRYNFRANFNLGGLNNFHFVGSNEYLFFQTNDSIIPLIGVSRNRLVSGNYQRIELGIEKTFAVWKLNLIWGGEVTFGHLRRETYQRVVEGGIDTVEQNGYNYFQYGAVFDTLNPLGNLNDLNSVYHYFTCGLNVRLGFKLDISPRFYFTSFMTLSSELQMIAQEKYHYSSERYKEHLVVAKGGNFLNFYTSINAGIHYRF